MNLLLLRSAGIASLLGCSVSAPSCNTRPVRYLRVASSLVLLAATSVPPATTCWELLHPLPIPNVALPDPNGYDDLVAAGKMFDSPNLSTVAEPQSTEELAARVARYSKAYERAQVGLSRAYVTPVWSADDNLQESHSLRAEELHSIHILALALSLKSELARRERRPVDAATVAADIIRLGHSVVRQGRVFELQMSAHIDDAGKESLYRVTGELSPKTCRELTRELSLLEKRQEPLAEIQHRERIFNENAHHWRQHLWMFLAEVVGLESDAANTAREVRAKTVATSHLLTITLALRAYLVERGAYPDELQQLVPDYLRSLPHDPFQPTGNGFVYRLADGGYVLYSFGPNGQDDGGAPYEETKDGSLDGGTGDLRLDVLFEFEEEPAEVMDDVDDANGRTSNNSVCP